MNTFKDKFDGIIKYIEDKGLAGPFDNIMGLATLDRMVNELIQTPELQEELHAHLRGIIKEMMDFKYSDEEDESLKGYV